jgi:hypothetical protein
MTVNIGDRYKVVGGLVSYTDVYVTDEMLDSIYTVVEDSNDPCWFDFEEKTVEIGAVKYWPRDFEKVEALDEHTVATHFVTTAVGKIVPNPDFHSLKPNWSIHMADSDKSQLFYAGDNGITVSPIAMNIPQEHVDSASVKSAFESIRGALASGIAQSKADSELSTRFGNSSLGVYRPNLEDRKVGKVRVELVDHGFPNALWELAKLMTWAQEAKGYKDHDWKNLPNAKASLRAAASRHRQKDILGELMDDESGLYHKVSEAFGVLAELELMLTESK